MKFFKYLILTAIVIPGIAQSITTRDKWVMNRIVNIMSYGALGISAVICAENKNNNQLSYLPMYISGAIMIITHWHELDLIRDLEDENLKKGYNEGFKANPNNQA